MIAPDETTASYMKGRRHSPAGEAWVRAAESWTLLQSDPGAAYDRRIVMDASAVALCRDNDIPIVVFSIREQGNLSRVLAGQGVQTIVKSNSSGEG